MRQALLDRFSHPVGAEVLRAYQAELGGYALPNRSLGTRKKGRQEAQQRALAEKRNTVRSLLSFGVLSDEQIAEATDLPLAEVRALRAGDKY